MEISDSSDDYNLEREKTSQYKGVDWNKQNKLWRASVYSKRGKLNFGGHFKKELDAAKRVNQLCEELRIPPHNPTISGIPYQQSSMVGRRIQIIHPEGIQTDTVIIGFNEVNNLFFVRHQTPLQLTAFCLLFTANQKLSTIMDSTMGLLHGKKAEFIEVDVSTAIFTVKVHNTDLSHEIDENISVSQVIKQTDNKEEKSSFWVKNEEEQKLKEYFVSNFNAFVDKAVSLDYLEIKIPRKALNHLRITPNDVHDPFLFVQCPNDIHLYVSGHNTKNRSYGLFLGKKFQLNDDEFCKLIEHSVSKTRWQNIFKLNGNPIFKFKFYFQQYGQNHQVMLGGETFSFSSFEFDLRKPSRENYSCEAAAAEFQDGMEKKYIIPHFTSSPKERVKILENIGMEFKFKFYPSHDVYKIGNPFKSFKPNYYFQKNTRKFDDTYYNFPKTFFCIGKKCAVSQNFNFQRNNHYTGKEYQSFDLEHESCFAKNPFFCDKIFDEENSMIKFFKDSNSVANEKTPFFSKKIFDQENPIIRYFEDINPVPNEKNPFFPDNIFDEENSIVKFLEDTNPVTFAKKTSPSILGAVNSKQTNLRNFDVPSSSFFLEKY